ncbi:Nose resistant to fluoxetine protein 6 [Halotydeus destructor]|nr:Nose resistant to fluoxetine protein 6 [Halotydeus destructor]
MLLSILSCSTLIAFLSCPVLTETVADGDDFVNDIIGKLHFPGTQSATFAWPDLAWINNYDVFAKGVVPGSEKTFRQDTRSFSNSSGEECLRDLLHILELLRKGEVEPWLLEMLDSAGKPPSGLLRGGITWPGYHRECIEVNSADGLNSSRNEIEGRYCAVHWEVLVNSSLTLPLSTGICVPSSCSGMDVQSNMNLLKTFLKFVPKLKPIMNHTRLNDVYCHARPEERHLDIPAKACLTVLAVFLLLAVVGTVVDNLHDQKATLNGYRNLIENNQDSVDENNSPTSPKPVMNGADGVEIRVEDEHIIIRNNLPQQQSSVFVVTMKSFSLRHNLDKLLSVKKAKNEISCVHGIRFLSMCWIIMGHTYMFPIMMIENLVDTFKDIDNLAFYTVTNGSFAVDSFFMLSGFLLSYLFFLECKRTNGDSIKTIKFWLKYVFHRIWRLTPVYALILWIDASVAHYASSGPYWDYGDQATSERTICAAHWWQNLVYVNNFENVTTQCMAWSWYLANDMQFYLVSPLFLIGLWIFPVVGFVLIASVIAGSSVATFLLSYYNNITIGFRFETTVTQQKIMDYFDVIYMKPYCRIGAYLVGIIVGYLISEYSHKKYTIRRSRITAGYIAATALILLPLYGSYHVEFTQVTSALYNSLSRVSWATGLALFLYLAVTTNGWVDQFLSLPLWIPLSRLTFIAYLIHPILINLFYRSSQKGIMFSHLDMMTYFAGGLTWVYVTAFLMFLLVESPLVSLERSLCRAKH